MDTRKTNQTAVVMALSERLRALDSERTILAAQVLDLEAQLTAARAAAEHCASEAIHLEGLVAFYEDRPVDAPPTEAPSSASAVQPEPVERGQLENEAKAARPIRRATAQWTLAWRDEAVAVLRSSGGPMHYRDLYRAISARGFTFGGKSPEASFLASLSRDQTAFVGVGRGCYWLAGEPAVADPRPQGPRRRARRPKPIGGGR